MQAIINSGVGHTYTHNIDYIHIMTIVYCVCWEHHVRVLSSLLNW